MKANFALITTCLIALLSATPLAANLPGQDPAIEVCSFPIYKSREVDRKVKILVKPEPKFSRQDRQEHASERIVLTAVLCGSGEVTQIRVKSGLSDSANTKAIEAARKIKFIPGEKDGNKISQSLILEYHVQN
ncbi:MAG TPA: hypothetical protein VMS31_15005 [Pyrinomonadaceae bacterium]|nr:hypothetical protein [Pyrinomonadaceae bacterium]